MPWFKVDDNLTFHAKVVAAGNPAMGLWVRAGSWCALQLTDGFIPNHMLAALGTAGQAERLVSVGLWDRVQGGFRFHAWAERQPTKADVEAERAAARIRMREARQKKKGVKQEPSSQVSEPRSPEPSENFGGTSEEVQAACAQPDPIPVPVPIPIPSNNTAPRKRGTRIPSDFVVTDDMAEWAAKSVPLVVSDLEAATAEFVDYWTAIPGGKGTKLDWVATWRVRMRQVQERRERVRPIRLDEPPSASRRNDVTGMGQR